MAPERARVAHSQLRADAFLPSAPAIDPDDRRLHRLPHVDVWRALDADVRVAHRGRETRLLAAGHQVVDEHTEPAAAGRRERTNHVGEMIDTVEPFDDDANEAEIF